MLGQYIACTFNIDIQVFPSRASSTKYEEKSKKLGESEIVSNCTEDMLDLDVSIAPYEKPDPSIITISDSDDFSKSDSSTRRSSSDDSGNNDQQ